MFDEILPNTPLAAIGINFEFGYETIGRSAPELIARVLAGPEMSLGLDHPDGGELRISENRSDHILNVFIRTSDDKNELIIATNAHYVVASELPVPSWSLRDKLNPEFGIRKAEAERLMLLISGRFLGV